MDYSEIKRITQLNGLKIGALLSLKFLFGVTSDPSLNTFALVVSLFIIYFLHKYTLSLNANFPSYLNSKFKIFGFVFRMYLYGSLLAVLVSILYANIFDLNFYDNQFNKLIEYYKQTSVVLDEAEVSLLSSLYSSTLYPILALMSFVVNGLFWSFVLSQFKSLRSTSND